MSEKEIRVILEKKVKALLEKTKICLSNLKDEIRLESDICSSRSIVTAVLEELNKIFVTETPYVEHHLLTLHQQRLKQYFDVCHHVLRFVLTVSQTLLEEVSELMRLIENIGITELNQTIMDNKKNITIKTMEARKNIRKCTIKTLQCHDEVCFCLTESVGIVREALKMFNKPRLCDGFTDKSLFKNEIDDFTKHNIVDLIRKKIKNKVEEVCNEGKK